VFGAACCASKASRTFDYGDPVGCLRRIGIQNPCAHLGLTASNLGPHVDVENVAPPASEERAARSSETLNGERDEGARWISKLQPANTLGRCNRPYELLDFRSGSCLLACRISPV